MKVRGGSPYSQYEMLTGEGLGIPPQGPADNWHRTPGSKLATKPATSSWPPGEALFLRGGGFGPLILSATSPSDLPVRPWMVLNGPSVGSDVDNTLRSVCDSVTLLVNGKFVQFSYRLSSL